jgi:hypothetical protein
VAEAAGGWRLSTVASADTIYTPKTVCKRYATVRNPDAGWTMHLCLRTLGRKSLAPGALDVGTAVTVQVRKTALGTMIVVVTPMRM